MGLLEKWKQIRQARRQTDREVYLTLIRRIATDDTKLSNSDAEKLDHVAEALGLPPERVEADVAALKEAAALEKSAAEIDSRTTAVRAIGKAIQDEAAAHTRYMFERESKARDMDAKRHAAGLGMQEASKAVQRLTALRQQHPQLFGLPEPAPDAPALTDEEKIRRAAATSPPQKKIERTPPTRTVEEAYAAAVGKPGPVRPMDKDDLLQRRDRFFRNPVGNSKPEDVAEAEI
jgi:hypothetical protein